MFNFSNKIIFKSNGILTLGVEIELQLLDQDTLNLTPRANELLDAGKFIKNLKQEFYLLYAGDFSIILPIITLGSILY